MSISNTNVIKNDFMFLEDAMKYAIKMAYSRFKLDHNDILVPYIVSTPGTGKSSVFEYINNQFGYGSLSYTLGLKPLEQLSGLPYIDETTGEKRVHWLAPEMVSEIWDLSKKYEFSTVLLDDFHLCTSQQQSYGFELFTYHRLHGYEFPKNVRFVVAGNTSSMSGAKQSLAPIMNRMIKIPVKPNRKDWLKNFAEPSGLNSIVCNFLRNNMNDIYFCEPESCDPTGSPRSWTGLANAIDIVSETEDLSKNINLFEILAKGCVSKTAAGAITSFFGLYSKVDVNFIFKSGGKIEFSDSTEKYPAIIAITDHVIHEIIEFAEKTKFKSKEFPEDYQNICNTMKVYSNIIKLYRDNRDSELATLSTHNILSNNTKFNVNGKEITMMDIISIFIKSKIISPELIHSMAKDKSDKGELISQLLNKK